MKTKFILNNKYSVYDRFNGLAMTALRDKVKKVFQDQIYGDMHSFSVSLIIFKPKCDWYFGYRGTVNVIKDHLGQPKTFEDNGLEALLYCHCYQPQEELTNH